MTEQNQNTTEPTTKAPDTRTPREKLVDKYNDALAKHTKLTETIKEIVAAIEGIDAQANIAVGTEVTIKIGKGETRREVDGLVIGLKDEEDGRVFKVSYGSGMDADVTVVKAGAIRVKVAAPAEQPQA